MISQSLRRSQKLAGLLHDIGKLGISNSILDKPDRLTDEEFEQIKKHPQLTHEILSRVIPFHGIVEVAASHHEKLDGSGYYRGLIGEDLNTHTRLLTVADIFDALSQERPYRKAMPMEKVLSILREESGDKLCPQAVEVLEELVSSGRV